MQVEGGWKYPNICPALSVVAFVSALSVARLKCLGLAGSLGLFLNLEGTVLLASAFTPVGLVPPQGNLVKWFLTETKGVTVRFNQPMFYGGLLCFFVSALIDR